MLMHVVHIVTRGIQRIKKDRGTTQFNTIIKGNKEGIKTGKEKQHGVKKKGRNEGNKNRKKKKGTDETT
jgi:hypothetical protein